MCCNQDVTEYESPLQISQKVLTPSQKNEKTKTNKLIKGFGIVVFVFAIGITFYTVKENYDGNNVTQSISVEKDKPKIIEKQKKEVKKQIEKKPQKKEEQKLELRKMLKNHPDFKDYYITLNELDVILKKISTKWPNGEWTKQIVLDNHKRIRVYCTHPLEFDGTYITEMTEGQLGSLYENTDPNLNLDKMPF